MLLSLHVLLCFADAYLPLVQLLVLNDLSPPLFSFFRILSYHPEMTWLLHTRRVPCLTTEQAKNLGFGLPASNEATDQEKPQTKALDLRCTGVGDMDALVWCCKDCINNLCRRDSTEIAMPPPALANLLWLGREHLLCQRASLGTRLLSCLGRAVWRKLILGSRAQAHLGHKDEKEKGVAGNCILLAEARPEELATSLPPTTEQMQNTFVVLFCRSIEEVSRAQMLVVNRQDYIALVQTRQRVCPVYAEIPLDEERMQQWPENDVPKELLACAQHLPETEKVCIATVGPASRPIHLDCNAHGAAKPDAEENADDEDWEQLAEEKLEAAKPTDAEQERQAFDTNTAEDVIAVDHSAEPGLQETFAAFQTKLTAVQEAASRVIAMQQRQAEEAESSAGRPADASSVMAAGATAARKEQCRTLVLETQELAKQLTGPALKRMTDAFAQQEQACVSTSGAPLSMFAPETWVQCFLEFFYGDAVPNMKERGMKGNDTVHVIMEDYFKWLQDREELEYAVRSDATPYKASATSRFDTPECTAIFGRARSFSS